MGPASEEPDLVLRPSDILAGAVTPGSSSVFVVGAYDSRITFYSQQVRALELVHALHEQGRLASNPKCAVIGGGAAGVTAAAALALVSQGPVDLYESNPEMLALQSASTRRRLDPHIYDWPSLHTSDPVAGLPILDWKTGTAQSVRNDVFMEFNMLALALGGRPARLTRHAVQGIAVNARTLDLSFERDAHADDLPQDIKPNHRIDDTASYDIVVLAFGFGLEPPVAAGISMPSYWLDGGVPGPDIQGKATPRFLVSGNGDGGLIDLVAAGTANFDHQGMIDQIIHQPGIDRVRAALLEIDREANALAVAGQGFDFMSAYDTRIMPALQQIGLPARVGQRLRPGVQLILQTLDPEPLSVGSAILNRLAAYLVIRACDANAITNFQHVNGPALAPIGAPAAPPYPALHWFECGGQVIGADSAIIRHGTARIAVRTPFENLLQDFDVRHRKWRAKYADALMVPQLSADARALFGRAARRQQIPSARWAARDEEAHAPLRIGLETEGPNLVWSGDVATTDVGQIWTSSQARAVELYCPPFPGELGPAAAAAFRLALHSSRFTMFGNVGEWEAYAVQRSSGSPHARHLTPPILRAGAPQGIAHSRELMTTSNLATALHQALDAWLLAALDGRIIGFTTDGADPGSVVTVPMAGDVLTRMAGVWAVWRGQFQASPELLNRFLRLMLCARDDEAARDEAQILLGPKKLDSITRAVVVCLAIASGWTELGPVADPPGNLTLARATGAPWSGHACGADLIDREPLQLAAARYMWRTEFVVLPMIDTPLEAMLRADVALADVGAEQPSLSEAEHATSIMLSTDPAFRLAARTSLAALAAHLAQAEVSYFTRLRRDVQEAQA
ncbi:ABC-three component system protein [Phenylobacterium sp.]|uniref:ABC-three component system protein n=1 Tax=Phenylobacterium sp. TaxID=1871053 RepID=UPI003BAC58EC